MRRPEAWCCLARRARVPSQQVRFRVRSLLVDPAGLGWAGLHQIQHQCLGAANANFLQGFLPDAPSQAAAEKIREARPRKISSFDSFRLASRCLALQTNQHKSRFPRRAVSPNFSKIRTRLKYDNLKFVKEFCVFEK